MPVGSTLLWKRLKNLNLPEIPADCGGCHVHVRTCHVHVDECMNVHTEIKDYRKLFRTKSIRV